MKEGNDTLRFHTKNDGNTINIRIRYNRSLDVYEIQGWHIDGVEHELIGDYDMVLFDKLDETIKEILKEGSGEGGKR